MRTTEENCGECGNTFMTTAIVTDCPHCGEEVVSCNACCNHNCCSGCISGEYFLEPQRFHIGNSVITGDKARRVEGVQYTVIEYYYEGKYIRYVCKDETGSRVVFYDKELK